MNTIVLVSVIAFVAITVGVLVAVLKRPNSSEQLTVAAIQARLADEQPGQCDASQTKDSRENEELATADASTGDGKSRREP
ncbi:hypothetical protein [Nocardia lijiangensis]|uniref:hypothetical protein n=1 Tax=Nocardia lijiangensis TaxID=299618 RepID=UPI00082A61CB|nr:hypothetical protein [Nocardia lijiangensis]